MHRTLIQATLVVLLFTPCSIAVHAATCGNGVVDPGEECDDGGMCFDSASNLVHCVADMDCAAGTCLPSPGDGCAADCTREAHPCDADCNRDGSVTIDEIIRSVGIALDTLPVQSCPLADLNGDGTITVNELLGAVNQALTPWQTALVDVGGHRLYIRCVGTGAPAVVLDSGLGDDLSVWSHVQPQVSHLTRVCSYNRAGLGVGRRASDPGPLPRTGNQMTSELHALLANSCVPGPYVLTGHSLGGVNTRIYAANHPDEVAGIVLVDSPHEDYRIRLEALLPADVWTEFSTQQEEFYQSLPINTQYEWRSFDDTLTEARELGPLPQVPMVVLVHGLADPRDQESFPPALVEASEVLWRELEADLAQRVTGSEQVLAEQSGHYIHLDQPDLVVDAVGRVVGKARTLQP